MSASRRQLDIQYLGVPGATDPCVQAMVTILTSPYSCREITALFCNRYPDDENKHYSVSFVVWDWLDTEITIIPDGFGTHSGTGGWGLGLVLALIEFYQVPLGEKWINDVQQFERINDGGLAARDRKALHEPDYWAPSWPLHAREYSQDLWVDVLPEVARHFPVWLLEPEIVEYAKDIGKDADRAVFRAVKRLEVMIREIGGLDAHLLGENLINEAMGTGKPLCLTERQSPRHKRGPTCFAAPSGLSRTRRATAM
jgi:hypothetical protein